MNAPVTYTTNTCDHWMTVIGNKYLGENYDAMGSPAGITHSTLRCPADLSHFWYQGSDWGVRRTVAINGTMYPCMTATCCQPVCCTGTNCSYGCFYTCWPDDSGVTMCRLATIRYPPNCSWSATA